MRGSSAASRTGWFLLLAALTLALGGCVERTVSPPRPSEPIGPIWGEHVASQGFATRDLPLVGLDVHLATYARVNQGTVTLRLRGREGGPDLRTAAVAAAGLQDNAMHRFRFEPVSPTGQGTWTFTVESGASSPDDAITIWASASDVVPGGSASYDGQPRDVDLAFTPVYAEPLSGAVVVQIEGVLSTWPKPIIALALVFLPGLLLAELFLSRDAHGFGLQLAAAPAFGLAVAPLLMLYTTIVGLRLTAPAVGALIVGSALGIVVIELARRRWGRSRPVRQMSWISPLLRFRRSRRAGACPPPHPRALTSRGGRGQAPPLPDEKAIPAGTDPLASPAVPRRPDWSVAIALVVMLVGLLARAIALEDGSVPPGADTYHHALIAQLIADRGQIPTSYRPYAEIDSFSYHFGFHAFAGLDALATGEGGIPAAAAVAPLVSVLPALSTFFLVRTAGLGRTAATVAAVLLALVDPFPVALLDIGRYPQVAALAIFPSAIAFGLGYTLRADVAPSRLGLVRAILGGGVLAAGLFLTHYRVILYLAIVLAIATAWAVLQAARADPRLAWPAARRPIAISALALVFCAPWLARLVEGFSLGLRGSEGRYAPAYYAIDRLGGVLSHPAVPALVVLALFGVGLAVLTRQPLVILLAIAFVLQLALSNPHWLPLPGAGWVDTVTVASSAFVAVGVAAGFVVHRLHQLLVPRIGTLATSVVALGIVGAAVWGGLRQPSVVDPGHRLVHDADLTAASWIRERLPPDARFLVNTFVLHWQPDFVAPTDAGYFLPLLAGRQTTLLAMVYPAERGVPPGAVERMEAIARATAEDPTSPEALALLRGAAITHVYIGVRRGPMAEYRLAGSPLFRRVYQEGGVSIYELLPGRAQ